MEHYDREGHQVADGGEPGLANREEEEKRQRNLLKL